MKKGKHDPGDYISVNLSLVPSKMEHILLEIWQRHIENHEGIEDSLCAFTMGKLCLTDLVAFCDEALSVGG